MSLALAAVLSESARRFPERTAVSLGPERVRYAELWEQARRYASVLQSFGVARGDRVAMMLPNVPDFARIYYGTLALGAIVVPVHALLTSEEVTYVLRNSGARLLCCAGPLLAAGSPAAAAAGIPCLTVLGGDEPSRLDLLAAVADPIRSYVEREASDDAVILYTSGTTGRPKGAVLSQNNLVLNATVCAFDLFSVRVDDVFLGALPLFHSFGQTCVMNTAFRAGAEVVLMPRFEGAAALDVMVERGVTMFAGVPTMYIALLEAAKRDPRRPKIRFAGSGGSSLPLAVLEEFEAVFGTPIYEGYGLSETSPVASFNQPAFGRKPGTVGCSIWGVDIAVASAEIEDRIELVEADRLGEIVIRGHCVFKGYLDDADATHAAVVDGWFRSGDLGIQDGAGFVTIVDRKKDMILRGGYNVYPREVEEVLMRHPAVKEVAVIGLPDPVHGEEIAAVVVAHESESGITGEAIATWSQSHLARYKYPRRVFFIDAMPLGPSGKVLKRDLRRQFA